MGIGLYMILRSGVMSKLKVFWAFSDYNSGNWFKENSTSSYYESDGSGKTGRLAINFGNYNPIMEEGDVIKIPIATYTSKLTSLTATNALTYYNTNGFTFDSYQDPFDSSITLYKRTPINTLTLTKTTLTVSGTTYDVYMSDSFTIDTTENTKIINLQGAIITASQGACRNLNNVATNLFCLAGQNLNGLTYYLSDSIFPDIQLTSNQELSYNATVYTCTYKLSVDSSTMRNISFANTDIIAPSFTADSSGYTYILFTINTESVPTSTIQLALINLAYSPYATWYYKDSTDNNWVTIPINSTSNILTINDDYGSSGNVDIGFTVNSSRVFYSNNNIIKLGYAETNGIVYTLDYSDANNRYSSVVQSSNGTLTYGYISFTYDSNEDKYITTIDISDNTANCKIISILSAVLTFTTSNTTSNNYFNTIFHSQFIDSIISTANEGYVFTSAPTYDNETYIYTAVLSNNDKTATFINILTPYAITNTPVIRFSADVEPTPIITTYPFVLAFSPTNNELNSIAALRFSYISSATSEVIDLGNYIIDLYKTYMPLTNSRLKYIVKMYTINTGVASYMIEEQTSEVDCGTITLFELFENNIDYNNTDLSVYLPFNGIEKLDTEKYMNKIVSLRYIADILTGDCNIVLSVYNDNIEDYEIVDIFNCNISYKIPYKINSDFREGVIGEFKTNSLMLMDRTPYIKIERPITAYSGLIKDEKRNTINTFINYGLCKFTDIKFSDWFESTSYMPTDFKEMQNMIIELLNEGVIL